MITGRINQNLRAPVALRVGRGAADCVADGRGSRDPRPSARRFESWVRDRPSAAARAGVVDASSRRTASAHVRAATAARAPDGLAASSRRTSSGRPCPAATECRAAAATSRRLRSRSATDVAVRACAVGVRTIQRLRPRGARPPRRDPVSAPARRRATSGNRSDCPDLRDEQLCGL